VLARQCTGDAVGIAVVVRRGGAALVEVDRKDAGLLMLRSSDRSARERSYRGCSAGCDLALVERGVGLPSLGRVLPC